jgi:hypothetical protein
VVLSLPSLALHQREKLPPVGGSGSVPLEAALKLAQPLPFYVGNNPTQSGEQNDSHSHPPGSSCGEGGAPDHPQQNSREEEKYFLHEVLEPIIHLLPSFLGFGLISCWLAPAREGLDASEERISKIILFFTWKLSSLNRLCD